MVEVNGQRVGTAIDRKQKAIASGRAQAEHGVHPRWDSKAPRGQPQQEAVNTHRLKGPPEERKVLPESHESWSMGRGCHVAAVTLEQGQHWGHGAEAGKKHLTSFSSHRPNPSPSIPEIYSTNKLTYTLQNKSRKIFIVAFFMIENTGNNVSVHQ